MRAPDSAATNGTRNGENSLIPEYAARVADDAPRCLPSLGLARQSETMPSVIEHFPARP
jgi:hypothetical protein